MKFKISTILLFSTAVLFSLSGCKKTENGNEIIDNGKGNVRIRIAGTESETGQALKRAGLTGASAVQTSTVPFGDGYSIKATLEPVGNRGVKASFGAKTAEKGQLSDYAIYDVLYFNAKGKGKRVRFTYHPGQLTEGIEMPTGTYTIAVASYNSPDYGPTTTPFLGLLDQDCVRHRQSHDALWLYRTKIFIDATKVNYLDAVLKLHFAEITTTIDASAIGSITSVKNVFFRPSTNMAYVYYDETKPTQYWNEGTQESPFSFNEGLGPIIKSDPVKILSDSTDQGKLSIGALTIGGVTKRNLKFGDFKIQRGARYNLTLKLEKE